VESCRWKWHFDRIASVDRRVDLRIGDNVFAGGGGVRE
jgi:hypothetical protein